MNKQRIVGTVESIVLWLAESDATSNQEDLALAAALDILKRLPEKAFSDFRTEESHDPEIFDCEARIPDEVFLKIASFLDRRDAHVLDCTLKTADGSPVIAMEDEGGLAFALVLYTPSGQGRRNVDGLAADCIFRRQMEEAAFGFISRSGSWKPGPIRFDVLHASATEKVLLLSLRKGAWQSGSEPGFVDACARERFAELVSEYRGTGDCFEGCEVADEIADLIESELL